MIKTKDEINKIVKEIQKKIDFSGVVLVKKEKDIIYEKAMGYANKSECINNTIQTRFGIASGCKIFTAIGICQLVEKGVISFHTKLKDCLEIKLPNFDEDITIHQLLTHSSGIPDYFDESIMDNFEDLWKQTPMYLLKSLKDFLPLFQNSNMMFAPGSKFHYNNAGFIILGLIIEEQTGLKFTEYIETNIFNSIGMNDSGYFSLDKLPRHTALGYIKDETNQNWRTNAYAIPIKGGADGGAYVTAPDMLKFWAALFNNEILGKEYTKLLLTPHIHVNDKQSYGYGIWIETRENKVFKYHVMGYDPGVSFRSAIYPELGITLVIPSNKGAGPEKLMTEIERAF
ncbi:TPA: serine hydrolase [Bacillus thuringiensis]|uniref:serine hydrolase domain-containing protein n=1 Tax=Bacillus TaxID=1386 RepID=UPI0006AD7E4C|nr:MULTISPECIES: serine hydrolase [Bacillus cereus group]MCI4250493.1 beta-lactamase family protein [Bacillus sp. CCB-MMP212]ALC52792.1 penicillin-binding protein [Bacillus cereus]MBG9717154.1 penicillin-binding protein [Bacillus cereus]MDZ4468944.1 serine hydrolase [Bacillus cereus]MDZ4525186.1 serine hydrolase [Bacillus cereus]